MWRTARVASRSRTSSASDRSGTGTSATSPLSGIRPRVRTHEAGDRVVVLVLGELDPGEVLDLVGAQQPGEQPAAVAPLPGAGAEPVVLVGDVADDLLDHVLEGDDAGVAAVLVEHDGHLEAVLPQQREQRVEPHRVGHDDRLGHDVLDPGGAPLGHRQRDGVLDVDGADHGVLGVEHREPRVAALPGQLDDRGGPVARLDAGGAHPRRHDLAGRTGAELDRALHQVGGLVVERALVGGALDQRGELGGAARRAELLLRLDAEPAHDRVGGAVEQPDRQLVDRGEPPLEATGSPARSPSAGRSRGSWGPARRTAWSGTVLSASARPIETGRTPPGGDAERLQRPVDQLGDRGLREVADGQVGDGDADLGAGELGGERAQRRLHAGGPGVTAPPPPARPGCGRR